MGQILDFDGVSSELSKHMTRAEGVKFFTGNASEYTGKVL